MPDKQNPFQNLRPMLLAITIGILQLFFWVEVLVMVVLGYFWLKNPQEALKKQYAQWLCILGRIVNFDVYYEKKNGAFC